LRYLIVTCSKQINLLIEAIRKHDEKSIITLVSFVQVEKPSELGVDEVLTGRESLRNIDYRKIDVAVVWDCIDSEAYELGKQFRLAGIPMIIGFTESLETRISRECGFDAVISFKHYIDCSIGTLLGFDTWIEIPVKEFINTHIKAYRVYKRARLGITLEEILDATRDCSGIIYVYDKTGKYTTTLTYRLEEGSLIVVVAPTEKALSTCIDRLNKLFTLAERAYASLEARRPFGGCE